MTYENDNISNPQEVPQEVPVKRGRGRPRKTSIQPKQDENQTVKRPHGRPRKSESQIKSQTSTLVGVSLSPQIESGAELSEMMRNPSGEGEKVSTYGVNHKEEVFLEVYDDPCLYDIKGIVDFDQRKEQRLLVKFPRGTILDPFTGAWYVGDKPKGRIKPPLHLLSKAQNVRYYLMMGWLLGEELYRPIENWLYSYAEVTIRLDKRF